MAKGNVKKKQQQHTDSKAAAYVAGFFLLLGLLTGAALFMDAEGGVAKCELYLLGKGSFVLPLACFLLSWKLFVEGKLALWQKKTLAIFLVMLCLLGTAHHVFVPMAKELHLICCPRVVAFWARSSCCRCIVFWAALAACWPWALAGCVPWECFCQWGLLPIGLRI